MKELEMLAWRSHRESLVKKKGKNSYMNKNLNLMLLKQKKEEGHLKMVTGTQFQTSCIKLFHLFKKKINQGRLLKESLARKT